MQEEQKSLSSALYDDKKTIPHLRWGSNNSMNINRCGASVQPPCRSFCIQIALLCANNEVWKSLCNRIECPPPDGYGCIQGPYEQPVSEECAMYDTHSDLRSKGTPSMCSNNSWLVMLCMTLLMTYIRRGI